jgi:hypothetical protein
MKPDQNHRLRNRPTNTRREPNPLTRTYDSNGPDVRIRGTARHVAEKYLQLARDAHTASNAVAAENYLQHAEHYFRLIAAAQAGPHAIGDDDLRSPDGESDDRSLPDRFALPGEQARRPVTRQARFAPPMAVASDDE